MKRTKVLCLGLLVMVWAIVNVPSSWALVFYDDFNGSTLDSFWWTIQTGDGTTVQHINNRIEMTQGSNNNSPGGDGDLVFKFPLHGDFTVDIDFLLINWPLNSYQRSGIRFDKGAVERISDQRFDNLPGTKQPDLYTTDFSGIISRVRTGDLSGTLRLQRVGNVNSGYYWDGSGWTLIASRDYGIALDNSFLALSIWQFGGNYGTNYPKVAFDNFRLNAPNTVDPRGIRYLPLIVK
jgi:hypothetical protein